MYRIYLDEKVVYDPRIETKKIISGTLTQEVNAGGVLTWTLPPDNPMIGTGQKMKSLVEMYDNDDLIFSGRLISKNPLLYKTEEYVAYGALTYFSDTTVRPYSYQGTVEGYLTMLISQHNSQVSADRQFQLGIITVTDNNDYITRANSNYPSTLVELQDKLVDLMGGYLIVRHTGSIAYLDYLESITDKNDQDVRLGKNIIDLSILESAEDIATAVIPLGAKDEETGEYLTIKSVNNGVDYVYDVAAVEKYGWIFKTVNHDDVTTPQALLTKGKADLAANCVEVNTLKVTAADLSKAGAAVGAFRFGRYTRVVSEKHNLDQYMLVSSMKINLLDASKNKLTLGSVTKSLATATNAAIKAETTARQQAVAKLADALQSKTGMHVTKEYNADGEVCTYYLSDHSSITESTFVIKATMQAIGVSTDGGITYPFGATINGDVVANILDTIGINADWINTGSLTVGGTSANADGAVKVYDANNKLICQINKSGLMALLGEIGGWKITDNAITSPDDTLRLDSSSGTITGYEDGKRRVQLGKQGVRNYDAQGNLIGLTGVTDLYGVNDDGTLNYDEFKGSLMSTAVEDDAVGWAITAKVDGSGIDAKQRRIWYERATDTFHFNCKTEINGGFSGGTRAMEQTVLWEDEEKQHALSINTAIPFADDITNYDLILFKCVTTYGWTNDVIMKPEIESLGYMNRFLGVWHTASSYISSAVYIYFNKLIPQTVMKYGGYTELYITKVIGIKFVSHINHSTSEQCVGTWVDGKPLYQRVIVISALPSITGYRDYPHGIQNIDQIAYTTGTARWPSGATAPLNGLQLTGTVFNATASMSYLVNKTNIQIAVGMDRSSVSAEVIIRYTKTTD